MADSDRRARKKNPKDWDEIVLIDRSNLKRLKEIVKKYGLIDIDRFGEEASNNAWLIVQHAPDEEVIFMELYLSLIEANPNKVNMKNYAYLKDRINLYKGEKQLFGTQFRKDEGSDFLFFNELDDPENVDKRRLLVNLPPLSEYINVIEEAKGMKVKIPTGYKI